MLAAGMPEFEFTRFSGDSNSGSAEAPGANCRKEIKD